MNPNDAQHERRLDRAQRLVEIRGYLFANRKQPVLQRQLCLGRNRVEIADDRVRPAPQGQKTVRSATTATITSATTRIGHMMGPPSWNNSTIAFASIRVIRVKLAFEGTLFLRRPQRWAAI